VCFSDERNKKMKSFTRGSLFYLNEVSDKKRYKKMKPLSTRSVSNLIKVFCKNISEVSYQERYKTRFKEMKSDKKRYTKIKSHARRCLFYK